MQGRRIGLRLTSWIHAKIWTSLLPGLRSHQISLFSAHDRIIPGFHNELFFCLAEILHLQLVAVRPREKRRRSQVPNSPRSSVEKNVDYRWQPSRKYRSSTLANSAVRLIVYKSFSLLYMETEKRRECPCLRTLPKEHPEGSFPQLTVNRGLLVWCARSHQGHYFCWSSPTRSTARKASWGMSTLPMRFIRFLPSFCFSSNLRLREMSPP